MAGIKQNSLQVLMTADTVGGVWTYCMELCRALKGAGVHFHLVTAGALLQPHQKTEAAAIDHLTIYETDEPLEWMHDPWEGVDRLGSYLLQLEQKIKPDLIHLNGFTYGSLPFRAPRIVVAHSDVFSWWQAVKGGQPGADWEEYFTRVQSGLQAADLVIAPSAEMMKKVREIYKVSGNEKVIYNGRSEAAFCPGKKEPVIMSMGRIWDEAKNIKLLVDAAAEIKCSIKIAGDNQFDRNRIQVEAPNMEYLGKLNAEEVSYQLSAASIYVLPARYEPFGLSVLEAALSGCALVIGDIPTLREIWQDAAVYVDPCDAGALAKAVNCLIEDQDLLSDYASKALERSSRYNTSLFAGQYLQTYQQLQQVNQPVY